MNNQFKNWDTEELIKWVEDYLEYPLLQNENNIDTFLQAINELKKRGFLYE